MILMMKWDLRGEFGAPDDDGPRTTRIGRSRRRSRRTGFMNHAPQVARKGPVRLDNVAADQLVASCGSRQRRKRLRVRSFVGGKGSQSHGIRGRIRTGRQDVDSSESPRLCVCASSSTLTRIIENMKVTRDLNRYQFDHGAQFIGRPKTDSFRRALNSWMKDGFVGEWTGNFASVEGSALLETEPKERYVGIPRFSSICRNLLHHKNIKVVTQTRALARNSEIGWEIIHGKSKKELGSFDWLVASDRNSGARHRNDLNDAKVDEFNSSLKNIKSVKSLVAMIVFERPLGLEFDGLQVSDESCGSLGWIARDTSKPGRERADGKECWVLQSHPDAAKRLLKGKYKVEEIRQMASQVLTDDFLRCLPVLAGNDDFEVPPIVHRVGHRWGAAFPLSSKEFTGSKCQVIESRKFAACGDYYSGLSGRVEGAYISGEEAASEIIRLTT
ncbi:hypothetical protein THAOC_21317 [Thalassiosira oceanica]|uniref:Amine oxidase domain-containing protein n=1 Tax=Thalassiosira oceanica TaxID=159749 RepID=K0RZQ7_THAOC|nr:hypothetical protein THAOC_21317 [Thalassiosira oceanica]|eukprot:EJK58545.1 hypothetical protein THAOC_21317 [Thalassiosira oceanica]